MASESLAPPWLTASVWAPEADRVGVYVQLAAGEHATFVERDTYGLLLMLSSLTDSVGDTLLITARLPRLARPSAAYLPKCTNRVSVSFEWILAVGVWSGAVRGVRFDSKLPTQTRRRLRS